ncbi:hypothetical protein [Anaeromicropila populeti]|uniref:Uncharacterized protein n=1 Tax=Anaeromicropila populeti TaxID=37658 RepID=A0A1I6HTK0_9FIRM|nr:hypothetical protein [Anaeromicropila populeti]SFR57775.1 hypothetical protein SAMN05661086_00279 [Anaeromicropila populeti]
MEYFILETDQRILQTIKPESKEGQFEKGEPFVCNTKFKEWGRLPDFFVVQKVRKKYFCFSDQLKQLFEVYADGFIRAVPFFPTDREKERQEVYWNLELAETEYFANRTLYSPEKPSLLKEPDCGCYCFQAEDEKGSYIIVSLHMVENMLRREIYGVKFVPIGIREGIA